MKTNFIHLLVLLVGLSPLNNAVAQNLAGASPLYLTENNFGSPTYVDNSVDYSSAIEGVHSKEKHLQVEIYPNPSATSINVFKQPYQTYIYVVADTDGAIMSTGNLEAVNTNIDISFLRNGFYVFTIKDAGNHSCFQKKLIKIS